MENTPIHLLEAIGEKMERSEMLLDAFYAVVERTNQTSEAYYELRRFNDLGRTVSRMSCAEDALQLLDNINASIARAIEQFDKVDRG